MTRGGMGRSASKRGVVAFALLACAVAMAAAEPLGWERRLDQLLQSSADPAALRSGLREFAAAAGDSDPNASGAALYYLGLSYGRDGFLDSAFTAYDQAVARSAQFEEREALVELLLSRGSPEDLARALEVSRASLPIARLSSRWAPVNMQARIAWTMFRQGQIDTASRLLARDERRLLDPQNPFHRGWRYRLAVVSLAAGDAQRGVDLARPLMLASRLQDGGLLALIEEAQRKLDDRHNQVTRGLRYDLAKLDREDAEALGAIGARRIQFVADDGFQLSGAAFLHAGKARRTAVIAIPAPGQTYDAYDSLCAGLHREGYVVMLMDPRGHGGSVGPATATPEAWRSRETLMTRRVARDVRGALRALVKVAPVDTTHYTVLGSGPFATIAAEAATHDPRVYALILLNPTPSPVDLGRVRAQLAALRRPVFFQTGAEDLEVKAAVELLYGAVDPRISRVAESEMPGEGPVLFRLDARALPRLTTWMSESRAARKSAPRPGVPRKG